MGCDIKGCRGTVRIGRVAQSRVQADRQCYLLDWGDLPFIATSWPHPLLQVAWCACLWPPPAWRCRSQLAVPAVLPARACVAWWGWPSCHCAPMDSCCCLVCHTTRGRCVGKAYAELEGAD